MSRACRFVGGPCDGEYHEVDPLLPKILMWPLSAYRMDFSMPPDRSAPVEPDRSPKHVYVLGPGRGYYYEGPR